MNNIELIKQVVKRLKKFSWLIALIAIVFGGLFYFLAKQGIPVYTSKSTVFPLNSSSDNNISGSAISNILGLSDAPKSFSGEASINIVELATSRRTREAVSRAKVPSMQNKTIAELLIDENNKHTGFMQNEKIIADKKDTLKMVNIASNILRNTFTAKINKNGILELYYSNTNQEIVKVVSYVFIDKISDFYIDLKKKKAQIDYEFAVNKADSLLKVLNLLDEHAIKLDETTFFTNNELKRFSLPKINLDNDKQTVQSQYYYAVNNREAAAYKLQKETPIIEPLDKPEGPYDMDGKSTKLYAFIGLLLGIFIGIVAVSWKIISNYLSAELNKAIEKAAKPKEQPLVQPQPEVAKL
ncbi:GumC domain-containing protein [Ferruginibacter profundus]